MNSTLDINTSRGREMAVLQHRAAEIVCGGSDSRFFHTDDRGAAKIDGVIVRNSSVSALAEIKSRNLTRSQLFDGFGGRWLLTLEKLKDIARASLLLGAPGYGFLYLVPDGVVLVVLLTDAEGRIVCDYTSEATETQATCNGGKANRENAFIDMRYALVYHDKTLNPK